MPYRADLPEYNGWVNYPTWNAMLWLSNDSAEVWEDFLRFGQAVLDAPQGQARIKAYVVAYIKHSGGEASCRADLTGWAGHYEKGLRWALDQIDWDEIVEHLRDAVNDALPATNGEED